MIGHEEEAPAREAPAPAIEDATPKAEVEVAPEEPSSETEPLEEMVIEDEPELEIETALEEPEAEGVADETIEEPEAVEDGEPEGEQE